MAVQIRTFRSNRDIDEILEDIPYGKRGQFIKDCILIAQGKAIEKFEERKNSVAEAPLIQQADREPVAEPMIPPSGGSRRDRNPISFKATKRDPQKVKINFYSGGKKGLRKKSGNSSNGSVYSTKGSVRLLVRVPTAKERRELNSERIVNMARQLKASGKEGGK